MSLSSLPAWHADRLLFLRERAAGVYGTNAYFAAVMLFDVLPLRVLPPLLFSIVAYPAIGLHAASGCLPRFTATLVAANVAFSAVAMAVGAAVTEARQRPQT